MSNVKSLTRWIKFTSLFDFPGHLATIFIVQVLLLRLDIHMNIFMTLSSLTIVENVQSNVEDQADLTLHSNER